MDISLHLDKSKKKLWQKLDTSRSVFINTSNTVKDITDLDTDQVDKTNKLEIGHDEEELEFSLEKCGIEKTKNFEKKEGTEKWFLNPDTLSKNLKQIVDQFMNKVKERGKDGVTYLVINKKKIIMQKIYYNLAKLLQKYTNLKVLNLEEIKGGTFTNPLSKRFIEPNKIVVILTRNHHKKELNILKEVEKINLDSLVIALNIAFSGDFSYSVNLSSIKTLYLFLYGLTCYENPIPYSEFVKDYVFEEKELDFEVFNKTQ